MNHSSRAASHGAWLGLAVLFALLALGCGPLLGFDSDYYEADARPPAARQGGISWLGGSWFLFGADVAWNQYGRDFGSGSSGGVSDPNVSSQLASRFAAASGAGMHTMRWYVFPDGGWQLGAPNGPMSIPPEVYADLDAALELAQQNDLYYDLVLFQPDSMPAPWIVDPAVRANLVDALGAMFTRYAKSERVLAWEVFSDPDIPIDAGALQAADLRATVQAVAQSIHQHGSAHATIGLSGQEHFAEWVGLGLDYLTAVQCHGCTRYADLGIDLPVVISTFASPESGALATFESAYSGGFAGILGWSLLSENTSDMTAIDFDASKSFASRHADAGPRAP